MAANAGLTELRIGIVTMNLANKKAPVEKIIEALDAHPKSRDWRTHDVFVFGTQETVPGDKLGEALLAAFPAGTQHHQHIVQPSRLLVIKKISSFAQHLHVYVSPAAALEKLDDAHVCHKTACVKSTAFVRFRHVPTNRHLVFLNSHLPMSGKSADLGLAKRTRAFHEAQQNLINRFRLQTPDAILFWTGDLNYRIFDGVDQLTSSIESGAAFSGWHEADADQGEDGALTATCKFHVPKPGQLRAVGGMRQQSGGMFGLFKSKPKILTSTPPTVGVAAPNAGAGHIPMFARGNNGLGKPARLLSVDSVFSMGSSVAAENNAAAALAADDDEDLALTEGATLVEEEDEPEYAFADVLPAADAAAYDRCRRGLPVDGGRDAVCGVPARPFSRCDRVLYYTTDPRTTVHAAAYLAMWLVPKSDHNQVYGSYTLRFGPLTVPGVRQRSRSFVRNVLVPATATAAATAEGGRRIQKRKTRRRATRRVRRRMTRQHGYKR
jgi:hypothetical protein